MIKNTLKNFFKNSYYIFLTMGILYLFILLTAYVLLKSLITEAGTMLNSLMKLISDTAEASNTSVADFMAYSMDKINWNGNFFDTVKQIVDTNWIQDTVRGFFDTLNASGENFSVELQSIIDDFVNALIVGGVAAIVTLFIGILLANYLTRAVIRRRSAKRNIKRFALAAVVTPFIHALLDVGMIVVTALLGKYALLVFLGIIALQGFMTLTSSWLIYRDKDLPFKAVVNDKNILKHLGGVFLLALFDLIIAVALFFISVPLAVLLMLPVIIYTVNVIDISADSYVLSLIEERKNTPTNNANPPIYGAGGTPYNF